jgi:hypothetical protein
MEASRRRAPPFGPRVGNESRDTSPSLWEHSESHIPIGVPFSNSDWSHRHRSEQAEQHPGMKKTHSKKWTRPTCPGDRGYDGHSPNSGMGRPKKAAREPHVSIAGLLNLDGAPSTFSNIRGIFQLESRTKWNLGPRRSRANPAGSPCSCLLLRDFARFSRSPARPRAEDRRSSPRSLSFTRVSRASKWSRFVPVRSSRGVRAVLMR